MQLTSKDSLLLTSNPPTDSLKKPFSRGNVYPKSKFERDPPTAARMTSPSPSDSNALMRQNQELRSRLHDEASNYRRRLDTYKQAQQNQAQLVSRLQSKVMQYKQRCSELEGQMHETLSPTSNYPPPRATQSSLSSMPTCPAPSSTTPAPMSLPCPSASDQHVTHSQHPIREYRDREDCLADDTFRRLEEERTR